uniref:Uncharacterized protein n=1 Tax=Amphimedon queenslandica TaxID=400682 RepID=A0A1X7TRF3_AMPQE
MTSKLVVFGSCSSFLIFLFPFLS